MKVQRLTQDNRQINNAPNFKGGAGAFLRYLATNQAVGANVVDLSFMVIPRTASDTIRRGPSAGLETGRREASGTANHTLIGAYGIVAGAVAAILMGINRKYGFDANKVMTAPETLNILAENKAHQIARGKTQAEYIKETLSNLRAFNPTEAGADKDGFVKLSEKAIKDVTKILDSAVNEMPNMKKNFFKPDPLNAYIEAAINKVTENTGAQSKYILQSTEKSVASETNLRTVLEDICRVSDAFNKPNVKNSFEQQVREGKKILENDFVKSLTRFKKVKSAAGFIIAAGVGMSIQPINMYLTKKKTGQDGFVGVEGRTKDTSTGFKVLKGASAAAFFAMVLSTLRTGLKGFMKKMAFTGFWPTISQLKGVYGLTIISRLISARDKDELREALTKDTLGFLSWLVLGDFVNKMTAEGLDKSVMNRTKNIEEKGFWGRVFNSSLKTRDEILIETLAKNGISTTKEEGGKVVAKTFRELEKEMAKLPEAIRKTTKKRLGTLNKAQLAGYLFSGLVLGLGIPNLNIYITNKLDRKRKAQAALQAKQAEAVA